MGLKIVTRPTALPVTLEEIKDQARVDFADDDDALEAILRGAIAYAERFTGRALIEQTWDYFADGFPESGKPIRLPKPPLISIGGVFYGGSGNEQEIAAAGYLVDDDPDDYARILMAGSAAWPTLSTGLLNGVRVRFTAGYVDDASPAQNVVPPEIRNGIILRVKADYDDDPQSAERNRSTADLLFRLYRVHSALA